MNAASWYEELTGDSPLETPPAPNPQPATESDQARAWLKSIDLAGMRDKEQHEAEFYKYSVSVYCAESDIGGRRLYLFTRSPQQKQWRRAMPTQWARTQDPADLFKGLENFLREREVKQARHTARRDAKRQAREQFVNPYNPGDILEGSWGYEQTNVDFFQVLEVRPMALKIRKVCQSRNESHGWMSGTCEALKDHFVTDSAPVWVTVQVYENGYHNIPSPVHGSLSKWDGKPVNWSGYH